MNFEEAMKDQKKDNKKTLDHLRSLEPLFAIALEHTAGVPNAHDLENRYACVHPNWCSKNQLDINIYLGKEDKITDVLYLVDRLIKDKRLEYTHPLPSKMVDTDYISCSFKLEGQEAYYPHIEVYIRADHSKACKRIGTGQYKEIMRTDCEDV